MAARSLARMVPALGLCLTLGISSTVWAQVQQQQPTRPGQQRATQQQREQTTQSPQAQKSEVMDVLLSTWLIGDNNVEVQLSRLAIDRSQNEQVRQFAQRMVQEHQQLIEQLHRTGMGVEGQQSQQLRQQQQQQASQPREPSSRQALQQPVQQRQQAQQQREQREPLAQQRSPQQGQRQAGYRPQADQQARSAPAMQLLAIHKEMGDQFVTLMRQELQNKQGAEFDRAFMGGQIAAHNHMLATLQAMEAHASPEMKKVIDQATTHTQQHLQEARNIAKQLEPGAAATAAQPEARETQRQ